MSRKWEIIDPVKEGDEVVYLGVYVTRWNTDLMGEPKVGFVDVDDTEIDTLRSENAKLREALETIRLGVTASEDWDADLIISKIEEALK